MKKVSTRTKRSKQPRPGPWIDSDPFSSNQVRKLESSQLSNRLPPIAHRGARCTLAQWPTQTVPAEIELTNLRSTLVADLADFSTSGDRVSFHL